MAYGNVLGYTPAPQPGAYNFQQANGKNMLLFGPQAEDLKAKLDASAGLAGQRTAGPGGGAQGIPANSVMAGSGALNDAPAPSAAPAMSVAPAAAPAPLVSMAPREGSPQQAPDTHAMAQELAGGGPAPESTAPNAAPQAPQAHALGVGGINTGIIQLPNGQLAEQTPGVAAVTQAQLAAKASTGVATPHSMSETVAGGFTPDANYLERRADLAIDKRLAIDKAADAEAENAVREKQVADQQAAMAAQFKVEEQARANQIQAQVQKDLETKDRLQNELGNAKVNPTRIFSGTGGTWRAIGAALSAGLGAAGSGMQAVGGHPGAPNIAYQAIQSAIDRDISAQENAIKVKGDLANNALSQWIHSGQSLEQAKTGLKAAQLQWTAAQLAQSAAMSKGSMVESNRDLLHNQVLSGLNDANEQYRQQAIGTRTQQVASQVVYPHAGAAPGLKLLTPEKSLEVAGKTTELGGKGLENEQKLYNLKHPKSPGAAKTQGALADNQAAQQAIIDAAAAGGMTYKDGRLEGKAVDVNTTGAMANDQTKEYVSKLRAAAPLVQHGLGAKRLPDTKESEEWASEGHTWNADKNTMFLRSKLEQLQTAERAIRAGGGGVAETAPVAAEPEPTE